MGKSVIDEALADAKQLKELAVENAKKDLINLVTPRIKQLVESQLFGGQSDDEVVETEEVVTPDVEAVSEAVPSEFQLNKESLKAIAPLLRATSDNSTKMEVKIASLGESVQRACRIPTEKRGTNEIVAQVSELFGQIENTYSHVHEAKAIDDKRRGRFEQKLESYWAELNEEFKEIVMNKMNLSEADEVAGAEGAPPAPVPGAEMSEDGDNVVITLKGLKDIDADALNVDVQVEEPGDDDEGGESEEPVAPDADAPDAGGSDDIFGDMGGQHESLDFDDDTILEIADSDMKKEIARMRRMHESDTDAGKSMPKGGKIPVDDFGGGKDDGDAWLDHDVTTAHGKKALKEAEVDVVETDGMDDDADVKEDSYVEMDEVDSMSELDMPETQLKSREHDYGSKDANGHSTMIELELEDDAVEGEDVTEGDDLEECGVDMAAEGKKAAKPVLSEAAKRKSMLEGRLKVEQALQQQAHKKFSMYKTEAKKCPGTVRESQLKKRALAEVKRIKDSQALVSKIQKSLKEAASNAPLRTQSKLAKENSELREQLAGANLLSAKLLYANKLLQTEGVTPKMRNRIIDILDAAESLREVKTLYTKLSDSLKSRKKATNESSRPRGTVMGSSSRVGQSAGVALNETVSTQEGVELQRWEILAGLSKK